MLLSFKIFILCAFALSCYECQNEDIPKYVLGKGHFGNTIEGNFFFAYQYCRSLGMRLVTPDTKEKHEALVEFLRDIGSVWTSGNDLAERHTFMWMTKGSRFTYTNWSDNQPDNYLTKESCVQIAKEFRWRWNDIECYAKFPVVCEVEMAQAIKC